MKIIIIGFAACYKTTVGKLLSQQLHCQFFDVDALVESTMQQSVAEIFAEHGEQTFRKAETEILNSLCNVDGVVSCGGGSVLSPNFADFAKTGKVVWLKGNAEAIKSRLTCGTRPLFDNLTLSELQQKMVLREKLYAIFADICVDTCGKTSEQVAAEVKALLMDT